MNDRPAWASSRLQKPAPQNIPDWQPSNSLINQDPSKQLQKQPVWQPQSALLNQGVDKQLQKALQQGEDLTIVGELVATLNPARIQEVAASQVAVIDNYYRTSLYQAQRTYRWALIAAGVGLIFLLAAVAFLILGMHLNISIVSLVSGVVLELIAATNFVLYGRALRHLETFHKHLDRTQQYLLANAICENLEGEAKQATQTELFRVIMDSIIKSEIKSKEGSAF